MEPGKEIPVEIVDTVQRSDPTQSKPTSAETRIHWAAASAPRKAELEAQFEAMRARNWITDRMVEQYQKHWHCGREEALERLLAKTGC